MSEDKPAALPDVPLEVPLAETQAQEDPEEQEMKLLESLKRARPPLTVAQRLVGGAKAESAFYEGNSLRPKKLLEAIFSNPDSGTVDDDRFYQQIDGGTFMDLPPLVLRRIQELSLLLFRKNAMTFCGAEVKNDFCIAGGSVTITAKDPKVLDLLNLHWEMNEWDELLPERTRSLSLTGELLMPSFVNNVSGLVLLSTVSPLRIVSVVPDKENGERASHVLCVLGVTGPIDGTGMGSASGLDKKTFRVMNLDPATGEYDGEAFYLPINRPSGAMRGLPDFSTSLDWMEGTDGLLFSILERASLSQEIVYDVTYQGATEPEINKKVRQLITSIKSGGVFGHNEKVSLGIKVPELGAQDSEQIVNILKGQAYAGSRLSGLFMGSGADLTKSSASELSIPIQKHFDARQKTIKNFLKKIFRFQIQEAKKRGVLDGVTDFNFDIRMPRTFLRDMATIASSMQLAGIGLQLAVQNHWIDQKEAANAFRYMLEAMGVDVAPEAMLDTKDVEGEAPDQGATAGAQPGGVLPMADGHGSPPTPAQIQEAMRILASAGPRQTRRRAG